MEDKTITETVPPEKPGFLELIYGVLLDPRPTIRQVAGQPPVGLTVLIFTLVSVVNVLSSVLVTVGKGNLVFPGLPQTAVQTIHALIPVIILLWLGLKYLQWFVYSGVLHLVATLLGGRGYAQGVFAVTGLAILPSLFIVPLNLLFYWIMTPSFTIIVTLLSLLIYVWGIILVIIGLREVYNFSTGKALLVLFLPLIAIIFFAIATLIILAGCLPSLIP
ncbi:MAG TPA: YIP1 family protein [Desulfotomaculum sp.]|nr:YIP1 family protein [Desulfotomaculum sp.]